MCQCWEETNLQTSDVSVTEVLAQLLHLLQLQQVDSQHLYWYDHQVVHLLVAREERFLIFLLMLKMMTVKLMIAGEPDRTCTKVWTSMLKESVLALSGDWVASSHFSNRRASRGKRGCLGERELVMRLVPDWFLLVYRPLVMLQPAGVLAREVTGRPCHLGGGPRWLAVGLSLLPGGWGARVVIWSHHSYHSPWISEIFSLVTDPQELRGACQVSVAVRKSCMTDDDGQGANLLNASLKVLCFMW